MRSKPRQSNSILGVLNRGDEITIASKARLTGEFFYWYKIKFGSTIGYIRSDFVIITSVDGVRTLSYAELFTKAKELEKYFGFTLDSYKIKEDKYRFNILEPVRV